MLIFPAIDLYDKKAVRLLRGDYQKMTVYSNNPVEIAQDFVAKGAEYIHMVDLEGAKNGTTPNFEIVRQIANNFPLFTEIGGGIRNIETVRQYLDNGIDRVILGTAAIENKEFLKQALDEYGNKIAVGADIKDGYIAIKGWLETSSVRINDFFTEMEEIGVKTIICTDISKDGAMNGTSLELYRDLMAKYRVNITASGGVSSIEDIELLRKMNLYGAIIGKAYYTGSIDLMKAIEVAR